MLTVLESVRGVCGMQKLVGGLGVVVVVLSVTCGLLLYQVCDMLRESGELQEVNEFVRGQVSGCRNQVDPLKSQVNMLESQLKVQQNVQEVPSGCVCAGSPLVEVTGFVLSGSNAVTVTVQNLGTCDTEGLVLSVRYQSAFCYPSVVQVGLLRAGEVRVVNSGIGYGPHNGNMSIVAALTQSDMTLDTYVYSR